MPPIHVELHETIHRPIHEVFDHLVNIAAYPDWMPDDSILIDCTQESEGPVARGTRYTDRTRLGTVAGEVTELSRPHRVGFHYTARLLGSRVLQGWPGYALEEAGTNATRVHHVAEARLAGPFKLLRPIVRRIAWAERQRTVAGLKIALESGTLR